MKQITITPGAIKRFVVVALGAALFSFSELGGDIYTIYLNKKQVAKEFVHRQVSVPNILLDQTKENDQFEIYYSHCGQIGKSRTIALRDEQNKVLKEWKFADVTDENVPMTIKVKDIVAMSHTGNNKLNLVYYSEELAKGRVLVGVVLSKETARR